MRFSKSRRLDPPKEQTPPHEEGEGPSKFDFRNHDAWTPQRSRHPSTRRGGGPSKFDFRNHAAWTPQRNRHPYTRRGGRRPLKFDFRNHASWTPPKEQTPLHEERGGGPQNSIFEIMPLGPPQRSRHPSPRRGGVPSKFDFRNHDAWTTQTKQTPLQEERVGALKIRFSKS